MVNLLALFAKSGVPGLANIAGTGGIRRILWLLVFIVLSGFMCHDLFKLFQDYISYPVTVTVREADSRVLPFPAVTVCNLNPVQKHKFCLNRYIKKPESLERLLCVNMTGLLSDERCELTNVEAPTCSSSSQSFTLETKRKKRQLGFDKLDVNDLFNTNITKIVKAVLPVFQNTLQKTTGCSFGSTEVPEELTNLLKDIISSMKNPACLLTPDGLKVLESLANNLKDQLYTCASSIMKKFKFNEDGKSPLWALTDSLNSFLFNLQRMNSERAKELSQTWENLILSCLFQGKDCKNSSLFTEVFYSSYGNCYTFNFHEDNNRKQKIVEVSGFTGPKYGLELKLNLNTSQYMPTTNEAGAKIVIHSPFLRVDADQDAIHVPPEAVTYIGVKMVNITRLQKPYPDECSNDWQDAELKNWSVNLNYGYTAQTCLKFCHHIKVIENCKCLITSTPVPTYYGQIPQCSFEIPGNKTCLEKMKKIYYDGKMGCNCPPRCNEMSYQKFVSTGKETKQCQLLKDSSENERSRAVFETEKAKVFIYFQSMSYQEIVQEPKYSVPNLIGNAGGILGVYIGYSFLVVYEIIEVLIRTCLGKIKKRSQVKSQENGASTDETLTKREN